MIPRAFSRQDPTLVFSPQTTTKAFSLIELLVVVAIIGTLTSILIPMIGRMSDGAESARHRQHAQSLASTYMAGTTAGAAFLAPGNLDQTIENIVAGATVQSGVFAGESFRVPGIAEADRVAAARFLNLDGDRLIYRPQG